MPWRKQGGREAMSPRGSGSPGRLPSSSACISTFTWPVARGLAHLMLRLPPKTGLASPAMKDQHLHHCGSLWSIELTDNSYSALQQPSTCPQLFHSSMFLHRQGLCCLKAVRKAPWFSPINDLHAMKSNWFPVSIKEWH